MDIDTISSRKADRFYQIDSIKGICILLVIISHFDWGEDERLKLLFPFWVDMAVPVFMAISGYLALISYKRNQCNQIDDYYKLSIIINKAMRITVPYTICFVGEMLLCTQYGVVYGIKDYIRLFLSGGVGPGSYYTPLMIQFIFVAPIIVYIVLRNKWRGVFACFLANIIYEVLQQAYGLNEECYRLLIFRYVFIIAFGCCIAIKETPLPKIMTIVGMAFGGFFIYFTQYLGYAPCFVKYWIGTSFLAVPWIIPEIEFILKKNKNTIRVRILEIVGKASFHIFLVQMVYYYLYPYAPCKVLNWYVQLGINIIVCTITGIIFYNIETKLSRRFLKPVLNS